MISFQTPISPHQRKTILEKRKWEENKKQDDDDGEDEGISDKRLKFESIKCIELHLESPLPLEWQRCLDIQSGKVHFYNTRTHKRTSRDPRTNSDEPTSPSHHMSLDLELNLTSCVSFEQKNTSSNNNSSSSGNLGNMMMGSGGNKKNAIRLNRSPSWLANEGENEEEMVATVCMRCHMLVMLCKSSPCCPNCKFMHSIDKSNVTLKDRCKLLC